MEVVFRILVDYVRGASVNDQRKSTKIQHRKWPWGVDQVELGTGCLTIATLTVISHHTVSPSV